MTKNAGTFKPGNKPWNKDVKGLHLSPATEYKKGRKAENWLPVGSVTIRTDKSGKPRAWVKVAEPNLWIPRAVFVWLENGRELRPGYILHHDDRDTLNDALDNLVEITRAKHLREHKPEFEKKRRRNQSAATKRRWREYRAAKDGEA